MVTEEVAQLLRTTPATVRYWRHTGYGPQGRRVGRRVLYKASEVEAFWDTLSADRPSSSGPTAGTTR